LLQEAVDQDLAEPHSFALNSLPLALMEVVDEMLARTNKLDPNEEKVLEDLMRGLLELRERALNQNLEHLRFLIQEAQDAGDLKASGYSQLAAQYARLRGLIHKALGQYTSREYSAHNAAALTAKAGG
jgi:hypothetical protein